MGYLIHHMMKRELAQMKFAHAVDSNLDVMIFLIKKNKC